MTDVVEAAANATGTVAADHRTMQMDEKSITALFKYRGRSLDNLKRVYAVILSVTIGKLLEYIYASFSIISQNDGLRCDHGPSCASPLVIDAENALITQLIIFLILIFTISVFYFQEDKLLDIGFGFDPIDEKILRHQDNKVQSDIPTWRPFSFSFNYLTVLLTLIPFGFLSFSAQKETVQAVGIKDFFTLYILLLTSSTLLATVNGKIQIRGEKNKENRKRLNVIARNWRCVNGVTSAILISVYKFAPSAPVKLYGDPRHACNYLYQFWFMGIFVVISMLRNYLDFRGTWPLLLVNGVLKSDDDINANSWEYSRWTLSYWLCRWDALGARRFRLGWAALVLVNTVGWLSLAYSAVMILTVIF